MALGDGLSRANWYANAMMFLEFLRNSTEGTICAKVCNDSL